MIQIIDENRRTKQCKITEQVKEVIQVMNKMKKEKLEICDVRKAYYNKLTEDFRRL